MCQNSLPSRQKHLYGAISANLKPRNDCLRDNWNEQTVRISVPGGLHKPDTNNQPTFVTLYQLMTRTIHTVTHYILKTYFSMTDICFLTSASVGKVIKC